jgi:hypothetical protein
MVQNLDVHGHSSALVCEFQRVRQEIQEDLEVPPPVAMDHLDQLKVIHIFNVGSQLNVVLGGCCPQNLECLMDGLGEVEILRGEREGIILKFGQI